MTTLGTAKTSVRFSHHFVMQNCSSGVAFRMSKRIDSEP